MAKNTPNLKSKPFKLKIAKNVPFIPHTKCNKTYIILQNPFAKYQVFEKKCDKKLLVELTIHSNESGKKNMLCIKHV